MKRKEKRSGTCVGPAVPEVLDDGGMVAHHDGRLTGRMAFGPDPMEAHTVQQESAGPAVHVAQGHQSVHVPTYVENIYKSHVVYRSSNSISLRHPTKGHSCSSCHHTITRPHNQSAPSPPPRASPRWTTVCIYGGKEQVERSSCDGTLRESPRRAILANG